MLNFQLTKSSSDSDLKRYFTAVLELSKSDNKFPINFDEVWSLVYKDRRTAVAELKDKFFQDVDYQTVRKKVQSSNVAGFTYATDYYLSCSCLEYFIARKVRPVFEVYRQVFHNVASTPALPQNYKEALRQLLVQVEENERLSHENSIMLPKARIYDDVIQSPDDEWLNTTSAVANEIGMSAQKLNKMLVACDIIYKAKNGDYLFTSDYLKWNLGKSISVVVNEKKGHIRTYIKWNTRGRAYIHALRDTDWNKRRAWHLLKYGKEAELS